MPKCSNARHQHAPKGLCSTRKHKVRCCFCMQLEFGTESFPCDTTSESTTRRVKRARLRFLNDDICAPPLTCPTINKHPTRCKRLQQPNMLSPIFIMGKAGYAVPPARIGECHGTCAEIQTAHPTQIFGNVTRDMGEKQGGVVCDMAQSAMITREKKF